MSRLPQYRHFRPANDGHRRHRRRVHLDPKIAIAPLNRYHHDETYSSENPRKGLSARCENVSSPLAHGVDSIRGGIDASADHFVQGIESILLLASHLRIVRQGLAFDIIHAIGIVLIPVAFHVIRLTIVLSITR